MTLDQLPPGQRARILDIEGGHGIRRRLGHMGIHPGDAVSVSSRGAFRGPFLVSVHGARVAIGRGIARRIRVDPIGRVERERGRTRDV
jgi:ferrous iron transport protein A